MCELGGEVGCRVSLSWGWVHVIPTCWCTGCVGVRGVGVGLADAVGAAGSAAALVWFVGFDGYREFVPSLPRLLL